MKQCLIELLTDTLHEWECDVQPKTVSQIADHLIDNGVIALPCRVGQMVYIIDEPDFADPYVLNVKVNAIGQDECGVWVTLDLPLGLKQSQYIGKIGACSIGQTIFLTVEAAEKALKGREK